MARPGKSGKGQEGVGDGRSSGGKCAFAEGALVGEGQLMDEIVPK